MNQGMLKSASTAPLAADVIKAGTTASFKVDVIDASLKALVVVDFWSTRAAPCKQLTPILEKVVRSYGGKVRLVQINVDENPGIAGQLRLQAVPTVYAFRDGKPLDGFTGAQPEATVRQIIDRLIGPDESDADIEAVLGSGDEALEAGDFAGAAEVYAAVLEVDPQNVRAVLGLAKVYLQSGDLKRAEATLGVIAPDKRKSAAYESVKAALDLAKKAGTIDNRVELEAKLAANPADHQARFDLAVALAARGEKAQSVDHLIEIVRRQKTWNEEAARQQLVQLFDAWGPKDPATLDGRRKLASLLFR
jgi:putative thioredoxin